MRKSYSENKLNLWRSERSQMNKLENAFTVVGKDVHSKDGHEETDQDRCQTWEGGLRGVWLLNVCGEVGRWVKDNLGLWLLKIFFVLSGSFSHHCPRWITIPKVDVNRTIWPASGPLDELPAEMRIKKTGVAKRMIMKNDRNDRATWWPNGSNEEKWSMRLWGNISSPWTGIFPMNVKKKANLPMGICITCSVQKKAEFLD